jgi:small subunit ribosomal protein S25e
MGGAKKTVPKSARGMIDAKKKEAPKKEIQKATTTAIVEPSVLEQIKKDIPKMKYVTPYQIYSKYNLKYSISKDILKAMAEQGSIKLLRRSRRVEIYVPAA